MSTEIFQKTANDYCNDERNVDRIKLLSKGFDEVLCGGLPVGMITEIYGHSGSGKTQLCYQFCVNVQNPRIAGGLDGAAIYVDTKYGFSPSRLKEIATAISNKLQQSNELCGQHSYVNVLSPENYMENILVTSANNYVELLQTIKQFPEILTANTNIRLIAIDSFAFPFNFIENAIERAQISTLALTYLQKIAEKYNCAIILTNGITTSVTWENEEEITSFLGNMGSQRVALKINLEKYNNCTNKIEATVQKSPYVNNLVGSFLISESGIF